VIPPFVTTAYHFHDFDPGEVLKNFRHRPDGYAFLNDGFENLLTLIKNND
jgi:hypothetical protein